MNIQRVDLNLLVYLDVLLRERSVSRAAECVGLSQPAMSNALRRLRELFDDPLLVRTSEGMTPTERALELKPLIREALLSMERALQSGAEFDPARARRLFRIMVSDYTEATLIPSLLERLRREAPGIALDILAPSDMSYEDVERGNVDLVINRFDSLPQSFHQVTLWEDTYACVLARHNPVLANFTFNAYLNANHIWVSKTGWGGGTGIKDVSESRYLGWVDQALEKLGKRRSIVVFTRHYLSAMLLAGQSDLIVTVPAKAAQLVGNRYETAVRQPPFPIPPIELKMAWSPLLQHNPAHRWLRRVLVEVAEEIDRACRARPFLE